MRRPRPVRPYSLYTPAEVDEIFRRFSVQRPEPKGELEHRNAFTLLVAVVLSAQATDAGVNKATPALFRRCRHAAEDGCAGRGEGRRIHPHDRAVARQGEERDRAVAGADPRPWRRGSRRSRPAGQAAGRRAEDRQCRAQHGLRPADHGGRHAHLPHRQPARPCARQDAGTGRGRAWSGSSRKNTCAMRITG